VQLRTEEEWGDFAGRLLAAIRAPVIVIDTHFNVVYFNDGAQEALGWSEAEMIGVNILTAAGISMSEPREERLLKDLEAGQQVIEDFEVTHRDGRRFPVLVNLTPFLDDAGELVGLVAIAQDITERWAVESTNWRLMGIVSSSSDAIVGWDLDGRCTSWNPAAEQIFGVSAQERIGSKLSSGEVVGPRSFAGFPFAQILAQVARGESLTFEAELTILDGTKRYLECTASPVRDPMGLVVGGASICRDVTDRRKLEVQIRQERGRLNEAQQLAKVGSFEWDVAKDVLRWSKELRRIVEWPEGREPSRGGIMRRVHPDDQVRFEEEILAKIRVGAPTFDGTYRFVTPSGSLRWLHTVGRCDLDESGQRARVVGSVQDVTERVEQDDARHRAEQQFSVAFELGNVGMLILGVDRRVRRVNPALCRMLGREPEEIIGRTPDAFVHPDDLIPGAPTATEELIGSGGEHIEVERRYLRSDGEIIHTIVHLAVARDLTGAPDYTVAQVVDITDRKKTEEELERLAMEDPLTGLPNRNLLQDRLGTALHRAERAGGAVGVIFVDIDHFKLVNDSLGHAAGDDLLRQLATRLSGCTRAGDTVARFGGDEFVLVCEEIAGPEEALTIGGRVGAACDEPFLIGEQQMYVTVSCGIVVATPSDTPATLLRDADTAMYRAKERGRARSELFDPTLRSRTTRRLDIDLALRRAIENEEFHLEYQPIVSLGDESLLGVEALVRWDHPERGLVYPSDFIQAAEDTGHIVQIGEWVLERAIAQTATWRRSLEGAGNLSVSVNLSPRQLHNSDLLQLACRSLDDFGLPAGALCLEITESAAMDHVDVWLPILRQIAGEGIVLAVDDFGAGHSSLNRLKRLPVKILKIDRSFVDGLGRDADDSLIVHAIVSLGTALGLRLCAEGVETRKQLEVLTGLGCHSGQGYVWARPMAAPDFEAWLRSRPARGRPSVRRL
jgi:diguanylate cyclase (GGDEF)-like protein/PAS domain S-box-containing protein